jgi:5'-nucleotidase
MSRIILITNDDGFRAEGIGALAAAVAPLGRVIMVAPEREQSAASHAITLSQPLRIHREGTDRYSVSGTPTDCVIAAINGLLDVRPDLLISGINHGPNMGDDVHYSGTVSAAFEGAILGLPALAVSLAAYRDPDFSCAARVIPPLVEQVLERSLPPRSLLNVNLPSGPAQSVRGVRITTLGHRVYHDTLVARKDPRGRDYYWIGGDEPTWEPVADTDFLAVHEGFVSVTPLSVDLTHTELLEAMGSWTFDV